MSSSSTPEDKSKEKIAEHIAENKEMDQLLSFIGGFKYWNQLNDDCRIEIIKHLDFQTRFNLSTCSKADWEIENSIPIKLNDIEIRQVQNALLHEPTVGTLPPRNATYIAIHFDNDQSILLTLFFVENEGDTDMFWWKQCPRNMPKVKKMTLKSCNYFDEAVKLFEKLIKRANFEVKDLWVDCFTEYPVDRSVINSLKCETVKLFFDTMDLLRWWAQRFPELPEHFMFVCEKSIPFWKVNDPPYPIPQDILAMPLIMNTGSINIWSDPSFTDEMFMNLKARKLFFNGKNVTDEAVNNYLKRWTRGEGVKRFKRAKLFGPRKQEVVLFGLRTRLWDDNFKLELGEKFLEDYSQQILHGRQISEFDVYVQVYSLIRPFDSLTVRFHSHSKDIHILRSGFQMTDEKGEPYAEYDIPNRYNNREYV